MHSQRTLLALTLAAALASPVHDASAQDGPPVNTAELLTALRAIRDQQVTQQKSLRQRAITEAQAAAANGPRAVQLWEDAVRTVQFNGAPREGAQFREWKEKDGATLSDARVQTAARLYFSWLALSLQRSGGATGKDMLPSVIAHTKDVTALQAALDTLEDQMRREKELAASGKHGTRDKKTDDGAVKRMAEQMLNKPVGSSAVVQSLRLGDLLGDAASKRGGRAGGGQAEIAAGWEQSPGNVEGMFQATILPEMRAQKDARLLEYWDLRIKKEADGALRSKLAFDADQFTQVKRPQLLWNRAQDVLALGQKNRAISEMFNIVKTFPTHPDADRWVASLEETLLPPAPPVSAADAFPPPAGATVVPAPARVP